MRSRLTVFPGGASQERTRPLGSHIEIDANRFAETLSRSENLRLMKMWCKAALPHARFECEALTLGGE